MNEHPMAGSRWADADYPTDQLTVVGTQDGRVHYRWDDSDVIGTRTVERFLASFVKLEVAA